MYSGTFSNKRTSKSLFKKSKVQLKKPCCPLTTATITTSFIQPIFLPWNHFLKMKYIHSPTLPLLYDTQHTSVQMDYWLNDFFGRPSQKFWSHILSQHSVWSLINAISKFLGWPNFQASPKHICYFLWPEMQVSVLNISVLLKNNLTNFWKWEDSAV